MTITAPLLLFGLPRSGTTWLGKIFDSHPRTVYRHEPDTFEPLTDIPLLLDPTTVSRYDARLRDYLEDVANSRNPNVCAKGPIFSKAYRSGVQERLYTLGIFATNVAARFGITLPVTGAPQFVTSVRLVWKSTESLGRLGALLRVYPDARSVHIMRHPCGVVSSVLRGEATGQFSGVRTADNFEIFQLLCRTQQAQRRGLTLESFRSMSPVERLAWRWVLFNEKAAEDCLESGRCQTLRYEDLCAAPTAVARRVFDFCDLTWSTQTDEFLQASTNTPRPDYYSVFKDPADSAQRWRCELPPSDIESVRCVMAGSELSALYPDDSF